MLLAFQLLQRSSSLHRQQRIGLLQGMQSVFADAYQIYCEMMKNASIDLHLSSSLDEVRLSTHQVKPLSGRQLPSNFLRVQEFRLRQQSFLSQQESARDVRPWKHFLLPSLLRTLHGDPQLGAQSVLPMKLEHLDHRRHLTL